MLIAVPGSDVTDLKFLIPSQDDDQNQMLLVGDLSDHDEDFSDDSGDEFDEDDFDDDFDDDFEEEFDDEVEMEDELGDEDSEVTPFDGDAEGDVD